MLDNFFAMVTESMENATATTNNSHKGEAMENATTATTNNSKASKRNSKAKASKRNSKASNATATTNSNATTATTSLPSPLPARCVASYSAEKPMDATTTAIFRHHIKAALAAYGGQASICQVYNFLRGDSPLRREKDGTQKVDGLPLWSGLGSSILFRNFTSGTYLIYTNKPTSNGRIRSVAVAGPLLQEAK